MQEFLIHKQRTGVVSFLGQYAMNQYLLSNFFTVWNFDLLTVQLSLGLHKLVYMQKSLTSEILAFVAADSKWRQLSEMKY